MVISEEKISFRRATIDDLEEIQSIERSSFKYPYSTFYMKNLLKYADIYYVAEMDNKIVGYIIARKEAYNMGHIISIAVHPDYRKMGIGEKMLQKVEKELKEMGCYRVYLEVRISNQPAISLYKKLGYLTFKVIHNYYADGEDAYMMIKSLI